MTVHFSRYFLATLILPAILTIAASPAMAETNKYYEACKTFGGKYEERRTDCEPQCKTTSICIFEEGGSRVCDDQGVCKLYEDGSSVSTAASSEPVLQEESDSGDTGNDDDFGSLEDCIDDGRNRCQDQCYNERGMDAIDCRRSCLERLEDQCDEYF